MNTLYAKLAEILEVGIEEVSADTVLRDFELWDSLTVLSILAMLDQDYHVNILATDLVPVITVGDLAALVQSRAK